VIVSDIMMPHTSGLELVAALKSDPDTKAIPILLLSAKAQTSDLKVGMDAGADGYITKPFAPSDLTGALRDARTLDPDARKAEREARLRELTEHVVT
jgi:CheY-like chemotaxis protein